jgi:hypothetical protein
MGASRRGSFPESAIALGTSASTTVTVATTDHFADLVRRCGLGLVSIGSEAEYLAATEDADLVHPRKSYAAVMERVGEFNRRLFEIVMDYRALGPLTVVAHSLDFASRARGAHRQRSGRSAVL